jgi:formylglycine-generating enzyme required for sulfatase activity
VNWYEAYAFCIWDGGFLPSHDEWEYAAAGGSQQREYPWGSTPPGAANQYAIYADSTGNCYYPGDAQCMGVMNIAPVGTATLGVGLFGQLDLAGDVSEWNLDSIGDPACVDCATFSASSNRTVTGGAFFGLASGLLSSDFGGNVPTYRSDSSGFRCARAP